MKTIRFIFSYILDAFRSSIFTSMLIIVCAVVSGYVTTILYGFMKGEVGDVGRMFVPSYSFSYTAEEEKPLLGTQNFVSVLEIADRYDAKFGRESNASKQKYLTLIVQYQDGLDPTFGDSLTLSWDRNILGEEAIEKGQAVAVVPQVFAVGYGKQVGDEVTGFGQTWKIVGISPDIKSIHVPYTCVLSEVRVMQMSLSIVPNHKLNNADLEAWQTSIPNASTWIREPQYKLPYAFLFATAVCSLNITVSAIYILKRAAHKYSVSKILGASDALVAGAMLCELGTFTVLGSVIGHAIALLSFCGFGIGATMQITFTFWDTLILLAANLVITLAMCAFAVIKRACTVPCKQ